MGGAPILSILLVINFATASMGMPLVGEDGKFAMSNLASILFTMAGVVKYFNASQPINRDFVRIFLVFNVSCSVSFLIFLIRFGWDPNFLVLLFQDEQLIFCALLMWYARDNFQSFRRATHIGIYCSALVMVFYGIRDLRAGDIMYAFGMDDKSQASVLICCEAYILARFYGSKIDCVLSVVLLAASFFTLSRLPVFFVPAIILAVWNSSRFGASLSIAVAIGSAGVLAVTSASITDIFIVFNRLSSVATVSGEASTASHLLLVKSGLYMKFSDVLAFVFGTGPGNFSKALSTYQAYMPELQSVDPLLVAEALKGKAPMHSTPVSLLLDWNIGLFLLCVYLLLKALRYLLQARLMLDLVFTSALVLASTFYSLHNKHYLFLVVAVVIIFIRTQVERGSHDDGIARLRACALS